jgi:hypothetical protein
MYIPRDASLFEDEMRNRDEKSAGDAFLCKPGLDLLSKK